MSITAEMTRLLLSQVLLLHRFLYMVIFTGHCSQRAEAHKVSLHVQHNITSAGQHRSHGRPRLGRWGLHLLMGRLSRSPCKNAWAQGGEETLKLSFQITYYGKGRYEVMHSDALSTKSYSSPSMRAHVRRLSASIRHIRRPWAGWKEITVP